MQSGTLSPRKLKPAEAIALIQQNRGKRYCPQVVDAFLDVIGSSTENMPPPMNEVTATSLRPGMVLAGIW